MYKIAMGSFGTSTSTGTGLFGEQEIQVKRFYDRPNEVSYYDLTNGEWIEEFTVIDDKETMKQ